MRSPALLFVLLVLSSSLLVAEDKSSFETITVENVHKLVEIQTWTDTHGTFSPATFSPDGSELAIALNNGQVEIISMQTMQTDQIIGGIVTEATWLTYNADGTELLLSNLNGVYTLVGIEMGEILAANTVIEEGYRFSPTADVRKYVRRKYFEPVISIHDTLTGHELLSVEDADIWRISYDGELLLTRDVGYVVQIWNIETGKTIYNIVPPNENVLRDGLSEAGFTPEGLVWTTYPQHVDTNDGRFWSNPIQFWNISSDKMELELGDEYGSYFAVRSLIFDPTNTYVLAYGLGVQQCMIWNLASHEEVLCPAGGNSQATFSADGRMIATFSSTGLGVQIRQVEPPGRPIAVLDVEYPWYAEFSPDGKFLVTIDHHIRLWGVPSFE